MRCARIATQIIPITKVTSAVCLTGSAETLPDRSPSSSLPSPPGRSQHFLPPIDRFTAPSPPVSPMSGSIRGTGMLPHLPGW